MYCYKCGKEISEEGKFCTYCGTKITAEPVRTVDNAAEPVRTVDNAVKTQDDTVRQSLVQELTAILPHVKHVEQEKEKIDKLSQEIPDNIKSAKNAQEGMNELFGAYGFILFIVLVIACFIVEIPLIVLLGSAVSDELFLFIAVGAAFILCIVINEKIKTSIQEDCERENREKKYELETTQENLREYCEKNNLSKMIEIVPKEYCYDAAISYILGTLRNGRAMDMQQAINLYEEYVFRQEVKEIQSEHGIAIDELNSKIDYQTQLIDEQGKQLSKQMSDVERSAVKAKRAARVSTALGIYNIIKK